MEKIEVFEVKSERTRHIFYCDDCGKELLQSVEYEDGYYKTPDGYCIQHVKLKGHHCKECAMKRIKKVVDLAISEGFDMSNTVVEKDTIEQARCSKVAKEVLYLAGEEVVKK